MEGIESEGKTVGEAVDNALRQLGLRRDQVEVQILQEASAGFLGMGAKPARVKISEKRWGEGSAEIAPNAKAALPQRQPILRDVKPEPLRPAVPVERRRDQRPESRPEVDRRRAPAPRPAPATPAAAPVDTSKACGEAEALVKQLFALMSMAPQRLSISWDAVQERVRCGVEGPDAERLISGDGRQLEALQFLATLMLGRKLGAPIAVQIDALGYWDKREKDIMAQAEKGVADVRVTGKPFRLPPMDAPMRRLIHRNLAGHPDVETSSEGEGSWRKIVIRPRKR